MGAFTRKYDKIVKAIESIVEVENPVTGKKIEVFALWDTGAVHSFITKDLAETLELVKFRDIIISGVTGVKEMGVFKANFTIKGLEASFKKCDVVETDSVSEEPGRHFIIGMNIISMGDFAISNYGGKTTFSFRLPSEEELDLRKEK